MSTEIDELDELPYTSYALIELLDRSIPHCCIRPGQTLEGAHRESGARELIDTLLQIMHDEKDSSREAAPQF